MALVKVWRHKISSPSRADSSRGLDITDSADYSVQSEKGPLTALAAGFDRLRHHVGKKLLSPMFPANLPAFPQ